LEINPPLYEKKNIVLIYESCLSLLLSVAIDARLAVHPWYK